MRLTGGTSPAAIAGLASAASASLEAHRSGRAPEPIMVLGPDDTSPEIEARPGTAFLIKTSGSTTGTGRFVELSWEAILASIEATHEALGGPGRWLVTLPIHHVAGLQTVLRSVLAGEEPLPWSLGEPIPEDRTYLSLVPIQLSRVLADDRLIDSLRSVTAILVGGQATAAADLAAGREAGLNLVTTYGMTETCGGCVYDGVPLATVQIKSDPVITITGDCVALGYAGGEAFNGTFLTSDLGQWQGDRLTILGRADDALTTGGLTIHPAHLENLVRDSFGLASIGLGIPDPTWGQALVLVTERPVDQVAVAARAKETLGPEYAPKRCVDLATLGLGQFPLTSSGKVDRRRLAQIVGGSSGSA